MNYAHALTLGILAIAGSQARAASECLTASPEMDIASDEIASAPRHDVIAARKKAKRKKAIIIGSTTAGTALAALGVLAIGGLVIGSKTNWFGLGGHAMVEPIIIGIDTSNETTNRGFVSTTVNADNNPNYNLQLAKVVLFESLYDDSWGTAYDTLSTLNFNKDFDINAEPLPDSIKQALCNNNQARAKYINGKNKGSYSGLLFTSIYPDELTEVLHNNDTESFVKAYEKNATGIDALIEKMHDTKETSIDRTVFG